MPAAAAAGGPHGGHRAMWQRRAQTVRNAYSLLEVMLASAICATALVPAMALLRDGLALADTIDTRHQILLCGVSKMEEQLAIVAARGAPATSPEIFRPTDIPESASRRRDPIRPPTAESQAG